METLSHFTLISFSIELLRLCSSLLTSPFAFLFFFPDSNFQLQFAIISTTQNPRFIDSSRVIPFIPANKTSTLRSASGNRCSETLEPPRLAKILLAQHNTILHALYAENSTAKRMISARESFLVLLPHSPQQNTKSNRIAVNPVYTQH